jgi:GntR family transcriptional regulator
MYMQSHSGSPPTFGELRTMGLVESQQGEGSIALPSGGVLPATRVERSIERTPKGS